MQVEWADAVCGSGWLTAHEASEKRKVGGSTPPLTTHYHQRIFACGLRKRRYPGRLVAAPWRPFQNSDARCGPMLGARRVHGTGARTVTFKVVSLSPVASRYPGGSPFRAS